MAVVVRKRPIVVLCGGAGKIGTSTTVRYLLPWYSDLFAEVGEVGFRSPKSGAVRHFRVRHNIPGGNGNVIKYTVRIAGSDSAVEVDLASTDSDGEDMVNVAAVTAGDLISFKVTKALGIGASPRNVVASVEIV